MFANMDSFNVVFNSSMLFRSNSPIRVTSQNADKLREDLKNIAKSNYTNQIIPDQALYIAVPLSLEPRLLSLLGVKPFSVSVNVVQTNSMEIDGQNTNKRVYYPFGKPGLL